VDLAPPPDRALWKIQLEKQKSNSPAHLLNERMRNERDASKERLKNQETLRDPNLRALHSFNKHKSFSKAHPSSKTHARYLTHEEHNISPTNIVSSPYRSPGGNEYVALSYNSNKYSHHALPQSLPLIVSPSGDTSTSPNLQVPPKLQAAQQYRSASLSNPISNHSPSASIGVVPPALQRAFSDAHRPTLPHDLERRSLPQLLLKMHARSRI
jgi:hypothetical protein